MDKVELLRREGDLYLQLGLWLALLAIVIASFPLLLAARNAFRGKLKMMTAKPLSGNAATAAGWGLIALFVVIVGVTASQTVLYRDGGDRPLQSAPAASVKIVTKTDLPASPPPKLSNQERLAGPVKTDATAFKPPAPAIGTVTKPATVNDPFQNGETAAFHGHRYQVFVEKTSWTDAKAKCEAAGGHLACVGSAAEDQFLYELIERKIGPGKIGVEANRFWLGGEVIDGSWKWITGEPWQYAPHPVPVNGKDAYLRHCGSRWMPATIQPAWVGGFVCEWDRS